jgi:hypothetical protein
MRKFLDPVLDGPEGFVALGLGCRPYFDDSGAYRFEYLRPEYYWWPDERDDLITSALYQSVRTVDVFYTPLKRATASRKKTDPHCAGLWLFGDADGPWTEERDHKLRGLGAECLLASSGSGGGHPYLRLAEPTDPEVIESLNRRLRLLLGGKIDRFERNGYLRPVATYNHKRSTRDPGQPATPVTLAAHIEGERLTVGALDKLLPPDPQRGVGSRAGIRRWGEQTQTTQTNRAPSELDRSRSGWLWRYVGQLVERGLSDEEIHTRARRNLPGVSKWGEGEDLRRDVERCIDKQRTPMNSKTTERRGLARWRHE